MEAEFDAAVESSITKHDNIPKNILLNKIDIESVSSEDVHSDRTEIHLQEVQSDTDRTASDFIEEIPTQLTVNSPNKSIQKPKQVLLSQNISDVSSTSPEVTISAHISESVITELSTNIRTVETSTPVDLFDSVNTSESRIDFTKTSYILNYTADKQKKKKNPKK